RPASTAPWPTSIGPDTPSISRVADGILRPPVNAGGRLSEDPGNSDGTEAEAPPAIDAERGGPDAGERFLQAARLAEARIAEVAAATAALKSDNDAFRAQREAQLAQTYEQHRRRVLLSSVRTLEALDRAIEAARQGDTPEGFVSGVMLVRTQLFRILQEEGLE